MNNKTKGIMFMLIASLSFAIMTVFVKLSGDLPSTQKTFFRNLVTVVVALIPALKNKSKLFGKKENQGLLLIRSTLGTLGIVASFYAIDHLLLADATMLNKLSPFFVIIFSFLFLKEKITKAQFISLIIAFVGSLFIVKPSFNVSIIPALVAILGAICAGGAYTYVRTLRGREKNYTIVFYFSLFSCVSTSPFLFISYHPMTLIQLSSLLIAGVFASIAQMTLTTAYSYAPASDISIYDYTQIIFSAFLGMMLFNEAPDYLSIIGYILIIGSSAAAFLYEKSKGK
ncbi:DMT family transporter [Clostridium cellulovorans]|uniref:EamA domain-containing protein n=1 Tax=Clostridium cellulovorans (strain ATCC 35296 / DSM 3052 / OCM 3 / 743B) TaxID=573061 RepID=D9SVP1_CLOC7|nr:DMT family transporter [Clostridium cellulovorans]ADL53102.1 protein of unknown function DUF6 transmembrane [Clostridium cellulovorans 743B]